MNDATITYPPELTELALKIADSCARSDIECNLPWVDYDDQDEGVAGEIPRAERPWYDTAVSPVEEWLTDALAYLEMRGLLVRSEINPALVRVRDESLQDSRK